MLKNEKGINTIEIIIILTILISIAFIFRETVFGFVKKTIKNTFENERTIEYKDNTLIDLEYEIK